MGTYNSTTEMRNQIFESAVIMAAATLGATFTKSEITAVFGMALAGAGLGGIISAMLSHVITGPGLEKMVQWKRWIVNWSLGLGVGFFGAWYVQKNWLPEWPVELCAALGGFIGGIGAVSLVCILWPYLVSWVQSSKYIQRPAEPQTAPVKEEPKSPETKRFL